MTAGRRFYDRWMNPTRRKRDLIVALSLPAADAAGPAEDANADVNTGEMAVARTDRAAAPPRDTGADPWRALLQVGAQLVAALAAANDPGAPPHPWIERDPATGAQNLKMPLPPPETARQIADTLSALADSLRGKIA